jgi:hypothetical protein
MKYLFFLILLAVSISSNAQPTIPLWYIKSLKQQKLDQRYELKGYLKPAYLEADFNGDGIEDIASLVLDKKTKKEGILLIHGGTSQYFVFGAGTKFGNGSDDFKWAGGWQIYKKKIAYEMLFDNDGGMSGSKKIKLKRQSVFIYDLEDGEPNSGGIIYWAGKKYIWIHQGE